MIKTSIIILNYNTSTYSERLIESIVEHIDLKDYEVILADNNSRDKSYRSIGIRFPFVKILEFSENCGFASGNNKASKYARGKYLLFLNPDILILDSSLDLLIEYLDTHPDAGIVSGLMVNDKLKSLYCFNSFLTIPWELYQILGFGYNRKIKKLLSKVEISQNTEFEVDWFHGAFILVNKLVFNSINGFNENHFMYCEDVELCYSIKRTLRLKNVCLPFVRYIHHTRATFSDISKDDIYYFHMNRGKLIFIRNYSFYRKNIIKLISLLGVLIRIICLPFWNKYKNSKKHKFVQLLKVARLHIDKNYLNLSKYEFIIR